MDEILHHLTTLPCKGRIATPAPPRSMLRETSEEVVQDLDLQLIFEFLTVVARMLTRENEGQQENHAQSGAGFCPSTVSSPKQTVLLSRKGYCN